MLDLKTLQTARALLEQPADARRRELRAAFPGYFRYCLFHVIAWPYLALRGWKAAGRRGDRNLIWRRLCGGTRPPDPSFHNGTLIVCTDLGETRTALLAAEQIRHADPEMPLAALVSMNRSYDFAGGQNSPLPVGYAPYNNPVSVWLLLARWKPQTILFSHHSHYHNHLTYLAKLRGVKTVILNASISDLNAERRHRQTQQRGFISWRRTEIGVYAVQTEEDRKRFAELGIDDRRIVVTGPVYATPERAEQETQTIAAHWKTVLNTNSGAEMPVVVAGSTYPGEEKILLQAFAAFQKRFPRAILVLAPRYLGREGGANSTLKALGVPYVHRSQVERRPSDTSVVLLDTFGELKDIYLAAAVAYIGGSLEDSVGGHTPVEALACGIPMTMGPNYTHQIALVDKLVTAGLLTICRTQEELTEAWIRAADADPAQRLCLRRASEEVRKDRVMEELYHALLQKPDREDR